MTVVVPPDHLLLQRISPRRNSGAARSRASGATSKQLGRM